MSSGYLPSPRNGDSAPRASAAVSWWICTVGHEWQESADQMALLGGCPICSGARLRPGVNDLSVTHPEVAALWDADANRMPVTQVTRANSEPVNWLLPCGHPLKTSPDAMVRAVEREGAALCQDCL